MPASIEEFYAWFQGAGGLISPKVAVQPIENMGLGGIAAQHIDTDELLFALPRELCLSIHTATLPGLLSRDEWSAINQGWTGLILCVMHERLQGTKWKPYLELMPKEFDALMFWTEPELAELKGSYVLDKIGKEEAEQQYYELVKPLVLARSDIFIDPSRYSLDLFHTTGSLILSRSFDIDHDSEEAEADATLQSNGSVEMQDASQEGGEAEEETEEEEGANSVGMVPFADILNAKAGANNAKLFYEPERLEMRATQPIQAGEQIYNTYAEPPNSDLLRRYGHVDDPNPNDVVEIDAKLVADVVCQQVKGAAELKEQKIEWLLECGLDDCFAISQSELLPPDLLSTVLLFACSSKQFDAIRAKSDPPAPQTDKNVLKLVSKIAQARLSQYETSLQVDQELLKQPRSERHRMALVVRIGEKQLLSQLVALGGKLGGTKRKRDT